MKKKKSNARSNKKRFFNISKWKLIFVEGGVGLGLWVAQHRRGWLLIEERIYPLERKLKGTKPIQD